MTQGHEATVQNDLIGLWSMADDACSHPDCDVVKLTGADSILLGVCNECTYNLEFLNIQLYQLDKYRVIHKFSYHYETS